MPARDPHPEPPVLAGYIERRTRGVAGPPAMLLRVWCRWCCRWHEHGLADGKAGDRTHRGAHCYAPDSPYKATGYLIFISASGFFTVRRSLRSASGRQRSAIQAGRISAAVQRLRDQTEPIAQESR